MKKVLACISLLILPAISYGVDPEASLAIFEEGQQISHPVAQDAKLLTGLEEFMRSCNFQYENHPQSKKPVILEDWNDFNHSSYIHIRYTAPKQLKMIAGPVTLNEIKIGLVIYNVLGKRDDKVTVFHKCSGYHWLELAKTSGVSSPITKVPSGKITAGD